jgi:hypothetical protein
VQARMHEWVKLTPKERNQARIQFQDSRRLSTSDERKARWDAYQALSPEERQALADRAAQRKERRAAASTPRRTERDQKQNIVPNTLATLPPPKLLAPAVVQANPGATTTLMSQKPNPPLHQQVGLPKIATSPSFVDPNTLLPRRGPQGAGVIEVPPARSGQ